MSLELPFPAPRRPFSAPRSRRAFTLLELLLSLALIAMLLAAVNTFVFSMGELWGRNADQRLFDQHVRAVTRYLDTLLRTAILTPQGGSNSNNNSANTTSPIAAQDVRPANGATETLLTFVLPAGTRVLPWPGHPLPDVECSLTAHEREGLLLYWHSRLETRFGDDPPRTAVITPLVSQLTYDYYNPDFKTWQNQTTLQKDNQGRWLLPTRLRVRFKYGALSTESVLTLPQTAEGLPLY